MRRLLTFIKHLLHFVGITMAIIMFIGYLVLHYNLAGMLVENNIQEKLSEKLNTRIEIGDIEVTWTNQIAMNDVVIFDQNNDTLFCSRRAMVALEMMPLLQRKLMVNTVQLIGFSCFVRQDSIGAEPNYTFLLEALMPKTNQTEQRKFINDIKLNALLLRQGTFCYDVLDQPPHRYDIVPDLHHLAFQDISASLALEVSHITGMSVNLKRMAWEERSGIGLKEAQGHLQLTERGIEVEQFNFAFAHGLEDGSYSTASARLSLQQSLDSLKVQLEDLEVDANRWARVRARLAMEIPLNDFEAISYRAEFLPSFVSDDLADTLMHAYNYRLPHEVRQWASQISKMRWEGLVSGCGQNAFAYQGHLSTEGLLQSRFKVDAHYAATDTVPFNILLNGNIASAYYQQHLYQDITVDGFGTNRELHADFTCADPLCQLYGHTDVTMGRQDYHIGGFAKVESLNPQRLHLTQIQNFEGLTFSGTLQTNLLIPKQHKQELLPQFLGFARLDSVLICNPTDTLELKTTHLTMQEEQGTKVFALVSPIANIVGTQTSLIGYVPAFPEFFHIMKFPGELMEDMSFEAEWDTVSSRFKAEIRIPEWKNEDVQCNLYVKCDGSTLKGSPMPEFINTDLVMGYHTVNHDIEASLDLTVEPDPLQVEFSPSTLTLDGRPFRVSGGKIHKEEAMYLLQNLLIQDEDQHLNIAGQLDEKEHLDLKLNLRNWQIDFFLDVLHKGYLDFGGYATGELNLYSDTTLHLKTYSLMVDSFTYIGNLLGLADLSCFSDLSNGKLKIAAEIETPAHRFNYAECDVRLHEVHDSIDLRVQLDSLPISFLSYWIGGIVQDLNGYGSGEVRLYGDCDSLNLVGRPVLQDVNFTHDFLGARFYISDTLTLEGSPKESKGFVGLNNVTVRDRNGQPAILTLDLEHEHLHNLEYGIDLDIPEGSNGFLIYDHPNQDPGELYWGRLWGTGRCQMHGTYSRHRISVQMSPAGRSVFNLSPGEENFTENGYNFLSFRDKSRNEQDAVSSSKEDLLARTFNKEEDEEPIYIEADLLIHANEHCQVYVQMDPLAEDRLICRGNGDFALHYDPYHDINLTGNYDITSGSYTVTMKGDVMTKSFQLQQGSRVTFPGSPSDAELNLQAVYNIPSANLRDLDESFASVASLSRTTLPVDCKLNVTGPITAPQIAFDLEVKNTSDDVQALVHNIIGTQEMLNREVFYLLLFSKFYTPEYASTSQRQTGSELTSFASSSLTSQLNNLLGHMSDNFTLGTNFRSDKGDFSDMEMDLSVSTRLLNDRLLMTGNLGYRDPANSIGMNQANTSFIGDFDVEFLINTRGTVRAKAYSHYNERDYSINNALTTQGIGIILRKDFNSFRDLLKRKQ